MLRPHPTSIRITRDDLAEYDQLVADRERELQEKQQAQKKQQEKLRQQAQLQAHLKNREATPAVEDDEEMEDVDEEEIRRQQAVNAERRERRGRVMGGRH
ncbi:hypothetical protein BJ508DRAFT_410085 [Ascobolus immersus RN42]|uniref:Uncharacterized protein n=1 Tax=Ascobolus immersus RN42 TaxID=1160509 RepID=A0A3N4IQK3_ASCIM|nr:hypothetical protein BJ508DRAFT_410085 [Ascobolus immersus RN42]